MSAAPPPPLETEEDRLLLVGNNTTTTNNNNNNNADAGSIIRNNDLLIQISLYLQPYDLILLFESTAKSLFEVEGTSATSEEEGEGEEVESDDDDDDDEERLSSSSQPITIVDRIWKELCTRDFPMPMIHHFLETKLQSIPKAAAAATAAGTADDDDGEGASSTGHWHPSPKELYKVLYLDFHRTEIDTRTFGRNGMELWLF